MGRRRSRPVRGQPDWPARTALPGVRGGRRSPLPLSSSRRSVSSAGARPTRRSTPSATGARVSRRWRRRPSGSGHSRTPSVSRSPGRAGPARRRASCRSRSRARSWSSSPTVCRHRPTGWSTAAGSSAMGCAPGSAGCTRVVGSATGPVARRRSRRSSPARDSASRSSRTMGEARASPSSSASSRSPAAESRHRRADRPGRRDRRVVVDPVVPVLVDRSERADRSVHVRPVEGQDPFDRPPRPRSADPGGRARQRVPRPRRLGRPPRGPPLGVRDPTGRATSPPLRRRYRR